MINYNKLYNEDNYYILAVMKVLLKYIFLNKIKAKRNQT